MVQKIMITKGIFLHWWVQISNTAKFYVCQNGAGRELQNRQSRLLQTIADL